ncbi:MAG: glycosyltransferase family 2 protein [Pseudomonadota bacterium]
MKLSIVICTRDRAATLEQTLAELLPQIAEEGSDVELVVVANDVSDNTLEVCRSAGVTCVEEPKRGLSHARNTSVAVTRGDAILWLDDDVSPEPGFLNAYLDALEHYPADAFFGGAIHPDLQGNPPRWAKSALKVIPNVWAGLDLTQADQSLQNVDYPHPYGANMLVRRSALVVPFRSDIGRNGGKLLVGGEETAFFRLLKQRGLTGRWVEKATVRHRIGPDRQTLDYVRRYFIGQGIQSVALGDVVMKEGLVRRVKGALRVARYWLRYVRKRLSSEPEVWLRAYAEFNMQMGRQAASSFLRSSSAAIPGETR